MFGIGLARAYAGLNIEMLGGTSAALLVSLMTRLLVGIGWYRLFEKAGVKGYLAFVPILGPYNAFKLVWDDFSMSAIFGATTFIAWISALGIDHPVIGACAVINFILWWLMALLTARAYQVTTIVGLIYGSIPWLGAPLIGFWPAGGYIGPWSSDPEAEQNLSAQERKKRRKKEAKAAKEKRRSGK